MASYSGSALLGFELEPQERLTVLKLGVGDRQ